MSHQTDLLTAAEGSPAPPGVRRLVDVPTLYLIDGTSLLFRAYYGMHTRTSTDGLEVGGVVGLGQLLYGFLRREQTSLVAVVFDAGQLTFRNRIDPRYKQNRGDPPPDLEPQFPLAQQLVRALGFEVIALADYEADDLMATGARIARGAGYPVRLVSPDKDLAQLVCDDPPAVSLQDPKSGDLLDREGVHTKFGVYPERIVEYMALVGDATDNVLGVRGVGPKAAQALVNVFGTIDKIYQSLDRVAFIGVRGAKTLGKKLTAGRDEAFLARQLVELDRHAPLAWSPHNLEAQLTWHGPEKDADAFFMRLKADYLLRNFRKLFG